jgi:type IV pilus assembly protein PilM
MKHANPVMFRLVKILGIGYITFMFFLCAVFVGSSLDVFFTNIYGLDYEHKSTVSLVLEICIHVILLGILAYLVRIIVKNIPFPLEDVSLDFVEVGPSNEAPGSVEVLIAAARRERVEALKEILENAGLTPVVVDVSSYALHRSLERVINVHAKSSPGTLSVLFKLGATASTMQVLRGRDLVYEREQSVGGAQLTQKIASYYGLSLAEAEIKKCQGSLAHDYETSVLIPYIDGMVQELGRALQFFFNSTQYNKVNQVFLAGGSALIPGLALAVAGHVQVPCSVVNPFEGMALGSSVKRSDALQEAPSYLRACGLALRRFFN